VVILGAAGRDFHDFNMVYRDDPSAEVVAFTAAQIPGIAGRAYPPALAGGERYPDGIPILDETQLEGICRAQGVTEVVFAYSDVPHEHVMHLASRALAAGADFVMLGPERTMLRSALPVIAVTAVRTGCGKSQIARFVTKCVGEHGKRAAVLRHPMPYGDLSREKVQRFETMADLDAAHCTAEEREEYEPHLAAGNIVFAGVDYGAILRAAEEEADIVIWDGGNNDFSFVKPDLNLVVIDALRPDQITTHHPGEAVARMADIFVVNKVNAAAPRDIERAVTHLREINPRARVIRAASPVRLDDPRSVEGKKVLVVEDGPTITHGGMAYGAGYVAAIAAKAAEIVDPRLTAAPAIARVYARYPHIGRVLPTVGYSDTELHALAETINASGADVVVAATPIDLAGLVHPTKPVVRARYEFAESGRPTLRAAIDEFLGRL